MLTRHKSLLITFDIDGTIFTALNSRNIQRDAFNEASKKFFGLSIPETVNCPTGSTEQGIASIIFRRHGIKPTPQAVKEFLNYYDNFITPQKFVKPRTFPGVEMTLKALRTCAHVGIATGCTTKCGQKKLRTIGFDKLMDINMGGFGEHDSKSSCILDAKKKVEALKRVRIDRIIHIGDTPGDAMAAWNAGATSVCVLTGGYPKHAFPKNAIVIDNMETGFATFCNVVEEKL